MKLKELYDINITAVDRMDTDCENHLAKYAQYKETLLKLLDDTGMVMLQAGTDLFLSVLASHIIGKEKAYLKRWLVRMGLWTATKISIEQCESGYIYRYAIPHRSGVTRWNILTVQYLQDKKAAVVQYSTTHDINKYMN